MISSKGIKVAQKRVLFYKDKCKKYIEYEIPEEEEKNISSASNHIAIRAFENIVNDCKEEIENAEKDQVLGLLNLFYNIDVETFDDSLYSKKIWEVIENYINDPTDDSMLVENDLTFMMDMLDDIQNDIGLLSLARKELKKDNGLFSFNGSKIKKIEQVIKELLLM